MTNECQSWDVEIFSTHTPLTSLSPDSSVTEPPTIVQLPSQSELNFPESNSVAVDLPTNTEFHVYPKRTNAQNQGEQQSLIELDQEPNSDSVNEGNTFSENIPSETLENDLN